MRSEENDGCVHLQYVHKAEGLPTDEVLALLAGVERLVEAVHEPDEHARVEALGERGHGERHLVLVLRLLHVLGAHLQLRLEQTLDEVARVEAEQKRDLLRLCSSKTLVRTVPEYCIVVYDRHRTALLVEAYVLSTYRPCRPPRPAPPSGAA